MTGQVREPRGVDHALGFLFYLFCGLGPFLFYINSILRTSAFSQSVIMLLATLCFVFVNCFTLTFTKDLNTERDKIINRELDLMLGHDIELSDNEIEANEVVMKLKYEQLDLGFQHPEVFHLSKHFFDYKDEVKKTKLYEIIKRMPKGAILHAHDTAILGPDYVLGLTYEPYLYVCFTEEVPIFKFSANTPSLPCKTTWQLMEDVRNASGDVTKLDAELRRHFTLRIDNPKNVYTDINNVWRKFDKYFISTSGIFTYKPVWEQYFYDTLKAFRDDNVMYCEIRSVLPKLYDLNGEYTDTVATAVSYKYVLENFTSVYPDFMGAKLIYAPQRAVNERTVEEYLNITMKIKNMMPDFFAGFDLVGQEDLGKPLKEFLGVLQKYQHEFDYYFHAGETNWNGMSSDENLVDAIVLGTRRIGHAYALMKHPVILEEVKNRGIAIEVNVISNAVLKLVEDVRNHPLAMYLAQNLPVVLSSDDPGVWEADPISHDFYAAFVAVASRHADLRLLKKLALNSLYYSSHSNKFELATEFEKRWIKFVEGVVKDRNNLLGIRASGDL